MTFIDLAGRVRNSLAAALFLFSAVAVAKAEPSPNVKPPCNNAHELLGLGTSLPNLAHKIELNRAITIVALGSSSTAGAGATSQATSYPGRLQVELQKEFPDLRITVINKGVNGEEVPDMMRRFDEAVLANRPDLLLWQLGTNALVKDPEMIDRTALVHDGIARARAMGADVVLVDPQYVPRVIEKPLAPEMVKFIATMAKAEGVGLYRRYELMKRWVNDDHMTFDSFGIADGLHLNDWGYACMAKGLSTAIAQTIKRPVMSASARSTTTAAVTATKMATPTSLTTKLPVTAPK